MSAKILSIVEYAPKPLDVVTVMEKITRKQTDMYFDALRWWVSLWLR